jgi:hypothetical protein
MARTAANRVRCSVRSQPSIPAPLPTPHPSPLSAPCSMHCQCAADRSDLRASRNCRAQGGICRLGVASLARDPLHPVLHSAGWRCMCTARVHGACLGVSSAVFRLSCASMHALQAQARQRPGLDSARASLATCYPQSFVLVLCSRSFWILQNVSMDADAPPVPAHVITRITVMHNPR